MDGNASLLSAAKAARRLGFRPRSWSAEQQAAAQQAATAPPPTTPAAPSPPTRGSPAALRARADPSLRHFDLTDFGLECGARLPAGASLAYTLHGPPLGAGRGIVLHPTSFDAVHDELE